MSIYRGPGGPGDAVNDASSEAAIVTTLVDEATTQAGLAQSSANSAAASASTASTQATNAGVSALAAAASETAAETAETNAETAEANAETAQAAAEVAQAAAEAAQEAAETAQTAAELAETNAETAETNAETAATNAASSASAAATSATNASNSASAAATSASDAATKYDDFDDRYLGPKATAPTVDNDGNTLLVGALYFNTSVNFMKVWDGTNWLDAYASVSGAITGVTATSPLLSSGGSAPDISIPAATTSASGYLTSTDWNTFNSKLGSAAIGSTVQGYDADTAKYDDTTANFSGTLQNGGSNVLVDTDIGSTVQAYDATILNDADIGVTVQAYDATILNDADIGVTVQAYDATIVVDADIGVSVQAYDADTAKTDVVQSFSVAQRGAITALTDGSTITPDFAAANNFSVTLGGNRTLANPTNLTAGQSGSIFITQDATGSRTLAYGTQYDFIGGTAPTLSTGANAVDRIDYVVRTTGSIHCVFTANYS